MISYHTMVDGSPELKRLLQFHHQYKTKDPKRIQIFDLPGALVVMFGKFKRELTKKLNRAVFFTLSILVIVGLGIITLAAVSQWPTWVPVIGIPLLFMFVLLIADVPWRQWRNEIGIAEEIIRDLENE